MIQISKIIVNPVKVDKIQVKWIFKPTFENFNDYVFRLERSESPESAFVPIFRFTDAMQYLDVINYRRLWKTIYYRIRITHIATGKEEISDPAQFEYAPNLEALEIIRRNDILLKNKRHGIGVPVVVFLRKQDGPRCNCWDPDKKRVRVSNCEECYQTGYAHGFYDPIVTWANMSPDNKAAPLPQWGETETNDTRIFLSNYPEVEPKDVIIEPRLLRVWMVENVETSQRRGHLLHQLVTMSYLDRNSVLYKLLERHPNLPDLIEAQQKRIELS